MEPREKPTFQESVFTARGLEKRVMMVGVLAGAGFVAFSTARILHQALATLTVS